MQIVALLQELQGDPDLLDRLTQHDYGAHKSARFHVSQWFGEQRRGRNLWRLKSWDLQKQGLHYRVIYAFEPKLKRINILAVAPRDFNYDKNHKLTKRIQDTYDKI